MKKLNHLTKAVLIFSVLLLTACSSQPAYRAATGNGFGYSEQQISPNYYRVTFKARGDDSGEARAYALRRATELTTEQGYDWFVIMEKETVTERQQDNNSHISSGYHTTTTRDCGLLGCRSRTLQQPDYEVGLSAGSNGQVQTSLEIRMGKGVMPEGVNSYPAR